MLLLDEPVCCSSGGDAPLTRVQAFWVNGPGVLAERAWNFREKLQNTNGDVAEKFYGHLLRKL